MDKKDKKKGLKSILKKTIKTDYKSIRSKENKEMIWNVLLNNKVFADIKEDDFNNIVNIFEHNFLKEFKLSKTLIEINKAILKNVLSDINEYKKNMASIPSNESPFNNSTQRNDEINKHQENLLKYMNKNNNEVELNNDDSFKLVDENDEDKFKQESDVNFLLDNMLKEREMEITDISYNNTELDLEDNPNTFNDNDMIKNSLDENENKQIDNVILNKYLNRGMDDQVSRTTFIELEKMVLLLKEEVDMLRKDVISLKVHLRIT